MSDFSSVLVFLENPTFSKKTLKKFRFFQKKLFLILSFDSESASSFDFDFDFERSTYRFAIFHFRFSFGDKTNLVNPAKPKAAIQLGSSQIYVPTAAYNHIINDTKAQLHAGTLVVGCQSFKTMADIVIEMDGGKRFLIPARHFVVDVSFLFWEILT